MAKHTRLLRESHKIYHVPHADAIVKKNEDFDTDMPQLTPDEDDEKFSLEKARRPKEPGSFVRKT